MDKKLIDTFIPMLDKMKESFEIILKDVYENSDIESILFNAQKHFDKAQDLLPNVSPSSPWLKNLIGITYEIGIWKELQMRGMLLNDISILNQKALAIFSTKTIPKNRVKTIRDTLCSVSYTEEIANWSKQTDFSDDWIIECVLPKENDQFNIGINIHRCPIKVLCKRLNAESYFPYLCLNDYVTHGMFGVSLVRTQTLAHGAAFCDFRLVSSNEIVENIITKPERLPEFQNKQ